MRARTALTGLLLSAAVLAPLPAEPQQAGRVYRVGYLGNGTATTHGALFAAFRNGLEELGWRDGRNISIEARWAYGDLSRHPALIGDLVKLRVEVIVLAGTSATQAARRATGTIPIVSAMTDPVGLGFAASLARPGGNVTGLANQRSMRRGSMWMRVD